VLQVNHQQSGASRLEAVEFPDAIEFGLADFFDALHHRAPSDTGAAGSGNK
jgi:hypothetical protein